MSESTVPKLTKAAQREAVTRPVIGGTGQSERQVELDREMDLVAIEKAKKDLTAGTINLEQFYKRAGIQQD